MLTNCFECIHFSSSPPIETGIPMVRWRFLWCTFYHVPFYGFARFHLVFCPEFQPLDPQAHAATQAQHSHNPAQPHDPEQTTTGPK